MGENAAVARCNPCLGRDDLAGLRNDMRFGPDAPGIAGDRSREIDLVSIVLKPAPAGIRE